MPSFLSKVFGRKKEDKDSSPTNPLGPGELLGGKFEAISPNVSPNAGHFLELQSDTVPAPDANSGRLIIDEKDFGLPFFRTKSRPSSPEGKPKRLFDALPPLSLDFDLKDKSAYNGYIFEESNSEAVFSDNVLGQRRLNPMEALILIRACSKTIISRGLETLGIMTPHWYSASSDVQRRLISNFLRSLDSTSTAAAVPSSPYITNFEDEVNLTRSIHDVAAVLRWGLRHLQLEGDSFGTNDGWYKAFFDVEAANDYPPKAFSEKLAPTLPASHLNLVVSTLEVFSSLAAFSEANSTSGSRLSKIFGLWLLTARRVEDKDDWRSFYARWERTGRMLEHLFLARIRDQSTDQRMPTRLLDLVRKYPFTHGLSPPTTDLPLLPYPQFTTALHPALFVRIQYEVTSQDRIPKTKINPSVLLADAFSTKVEEGEFVELWAKITSAASKTSSELPLGNVLADESLRLLSLLADKPKEEVKSPALSVLSLTEPQLQRAASNGAASFSLLRPNTESAPLTTTATLSPLGGDWEQFSASGFLGIDQTFPPLVSTLFDTDIEKTEPRNIPLPISRKSSRRAVRKSLELPRSVIIAESSSNSSPDTSKSSRQGVITASQFEVIEFDEAFVDFWSDALLDPIASNWPTFVVCKFKPTLVPELTYGTGDETTKTLKWLVLEQVYSVKPRRVPSPLLTLPVSAEPSSARPASPIAQTPTGRRLFNFWSMSRTPSSSSTGSQKTWRTPKSPKSPRVGEMGELIEEDEGRGRSPISKKFKSLDFGVRRSAGKKSDEKKRSADVTRPEISITSPTDAEARATFSPIVAASAVTATGVAAAATTAVRLATEKSEGDIVKEMELSTVPEAATESSGPVLVPESMDEQDFIPVEAEADEATVLAVIPEQGAHVVDAGAPAELTIASLPDTAVVADEPQPGEGGATIEEALEVDQSFLVSAAPTSAESSFDRPLPPDVELPVQLDGEVEEKISLSAAIESDKPLLDDVTAVSEEHRALLMTGEDEEATGEEPGGGVSEEPELEIGQEGALESPTEAAAIAVATLPEVETEPETRISKPVEDEEAPPTEMFVPTTSVAEPIVDEPVVIEAPTVEVLDDRGSFLEEVPRSVAAAPTEVVPSVDYVATKGIGPSLEETETDESFVGGAPAPPDLSSAVVDRVEEVLPAAEASTALEAPPTLDDASAPTQAAEVVVPREVSEPLLEVGGTVAAEFSPDEPLTDAAIEISEEVAAEASAEQAIDESLALETPVEPAVEEPEPSVVALQELSPSEPPIEIVAPQETTENLPTESETVEHLTIENARIAEGSPGVGIGVIATAGEVPVDEGAAVVEERIHEVRAVKAEPTERSVDIETQETTPDEVPVSGGPSEPSKDTARETAASEDLVEAPLDYSLAPDEPQADVPQAEPTSEEPPEQPIITSGEAVILTGEEPSQQPPILKEEELSSQLEEAPLVVRQLPTEVPHEEPALETKVPEEPPTTEPELPIEEPETLLEDAPIEVVQVVEKPDASNEVPLVEDVALAEAAVLDVPEHEVISSTSEVPDVGEASRPGEEISVEAEEFLELALPTSEDAHPDFADPPPIAEVTPPTEEESLANDEVTATYEEKRVAEETHITVPEAIGAVERIAETTPEIKESDATPESVTASVPEVSEESPSVSGEAIAVTVGEPIASVITEPALGEVPSEPQALPDVPEVLENAPAMVEEVDDPVNVDDSIDPSTAVDEPEQSMRVSIENASTPIVETLSHEPLPLDTSPVPLAETSTSARATPKTTEDEESLAPPHDQFDKAEVFAAAEKPSTIEEGLPSAADAEKNILTSIPLEEGVSPLVDEIQPVPGEESPETFEAARTVPDAVEDVSVPVDETAPAIPDANQPTVTAADETSAFAEAILEAGPQPVLETAVEPPETSAAASEESEQPGARGDNTNSIPAPVDVSADIDQPILTQGVELSVEGGIIDEPTVESAARDDLSLEKPDDPTIPDAHVTTSTSELPNDPLEEELLQDEAADATAYTLDRITATSISEKGPVQTPIQNPPQSVIGAESGVVSVSLEPSSGSDDLAPPEQLEHPTSILAIPEETDTNEPVILEEVDDVRAFVEEPGAVAEPSGEPAVVQLEEPESASELPNIDASTEATDTTIITTPDIDGEAVSDESAANESSEVKSSLEQLKEGKNAIDVETTQQVDPIAIDETQA